MNPLDRMICQMHVRGQRQEHARSSDGESRTNIYPRVADASVPYYPPALDMGTHAEADRERGHRSVALPIEGVDELRAREDMDNLFQLCRNDDWDEVLRIVRENPTVALTPMIMDNHIATTILHQAITSKGDTARRAEVMETVLDQTPQSAAIKNGYGSLPLHVISQRNTKINSDIKERLIARLVQAYPGALTEQGGVGKRTPLHIIFTDYISADLTRMMVDNGREACFMKDKKGYLPAHVACSRHCSPEKLRMLLDVNPAALHDTTNDGQTLYGLATSTATKSHPNYALISELHRHLGSVALVSSEEWEATRDRLGSNDSSNDGDAGQWYRHPNDPSGYSHLRQSHLQQPDSRHYSHPHQSHPQPPSERSYSPESNRKFSPVRRKQHVRAVSTMKNPTHRELSMNRPELTLLSVTPGAPNGKDSGTPQGHAPGVYPVVTNSQPSKKRKAATYLQSTAENEQHHYREDPAAHLLLHFSRNGTSGSRASSPSRFAQV